ncbi:MAG: PqqD family protein [Deltaproteobacteria bacterium]|nr:MAG: PqqD family protein [Deltaproteobacteria bacterium]
MSSLEMKYRRNEHFVFRKIGDEMILVPIKDNVGNMGYIYNLNELGAFIWQHLDGSNRLVEINKMISEEFEVSDQEAKEDLRTFLGDLEEIGAISEMKHGA